MSEPFGFPPTDRDIAEFYMKQVRDLRDENAEQAAEIAYLKRSLAYIAKRKSDNADWTQAHNALAVYGWPKGAD